MNSELCRQGGERFKPWSCAELEAATFDLDFIVEDVLVAGQPCIIGGAAKCLKTSIAIDLAVSVATGTEFLGRFRVDSPRAVAIMSGESGAATIRDLVRRVCISRGRKLAEITSLQFIFDVPRLDDGKQVAEVEQIISEHGIKLLIVDPVYLALGGDDAANVFKQGEKLNAIKKVCERHGATLVLVHHFSRSASRLRGSGPPGLDDLAFAGFTEFARQCILIGRRAEYVAGTGRHQLWLTIGGSAGHQGGYGLDVDEGREGERRWSASVLSADELEREQRRRGERKAKADDELDRRVLTYLEGKEPQAAKQIREALDPEPNHRKLGECLDRLQIASEILATEEKRPKRKDPVKVYSLSKAA